MNEEPVYNIGIVARMTGVPENTLRVWERRYDFPQSARTEGGHRLYAPREVARIQWVKQRIDEGMQTRNAIHVLEQVEADGRFPDMLNGAPTAPVIPDVSGEAIREHLFAALVDHDEDRANQITGEALAAFSVEQLILSVIGPTFTAFGQAWAEGRINIATEHYATNYLRQQLLIWLHTAPFAYPVRPVILACAPGELHEGGLLMLGVMLRRLRNSSDRDAIDDEIAKMEPAGSLPLYRIVRELRRADELLRSKKQEDQDKGDKLLKETLRRLR